MEEAQEKQGESGDSTRRSYRWLKIIGILVLIPIFACSALYFTGKLLTSRIETEPDPQALKSWGPGTSFLSTRSGDVNVLDIGEGDAVLLIHGSTGSIVDWQEGVVDRLAESHRVVAFDSYGFGLSERNDSFKYGHALWTQQAKTFSTLWKSSRPR
jgi:hypothetical protein